MKRLTLEGMEPQYLQFCKDADELRAALSRKGSWRTWSVAELGSNE